MNDTDKELTNTQRPGISAKHLADEDVRHIDADTANQRCGIRESGLWIPYRTMTGEPVMDGSSEYGRLRLDTPRGHQKYHQRARSQVHAYIPKDLPTYGQGRSLDLTIVEGEFKAIALTGARFPSIGLSGFYGFRRPAKTGQEVITPELDDALGVLNPRRIYFVGDRDTSLNWQFADAACSLARLLRQPIYLPRIHLSDESKGVDDLREVLKDKFVDFWKGRMNQAIRVDCDTEREDLVLTLLEPELRCLSAELGRDGATVEKRLGELGRALKKSHHKSQSFLGMMERAGIGRATVKQLIVAASETAKNELRRQQEAIIQELLDDPKYEKLRIEQQPHRLSDNGKRFDISDSFIARMFSLDHHVLYDPAEADFFLYDDATGLWVRQTEASIKERLAEDLLAFGERVGLSEEYAFKRKDSVLAALMRRLRSITERRDYFTPLKDRPFVHLKNGILEFDGPNLPIREFCPGWRSRNLIPVEWPGWTEKPACRRFLDEVLRPQLDDDDISLFQRWAGLLLVGGNPAGKVVIMTGKSHTSKSTIAELIQATIGVENCSELRTEILGERFEIGSFLGKRLLIGPDVRQAFLQKNGAQALKKLTGGDLLVSEKKGSNERRCFRGNFDVLIYANTRLLLDVDGESTAREERLIEFEFKGEGHADRIPDFANKLVNEEGQAILQWMVQGAFRALDELKKEPGRLVMTNRQRDRVRALLNQSDSVRSFVRSMVQPESGATVSTEELCEAYYNYCLKLGWKALEEGQLQRALTPMMHEVFNVTKATDILRRGTKHRGWRGLSVKRSP